jgi:flagellar hook-basal body complex protein FliE
MAGISGLGGNTQWMFPLESELALKNKRSDELGLSQSGGVGGMNPVSPSAPGSASFIDSLKNALQDVNEIKVQANTVANGVATGAGGSLDTAMILQTKAEIAVKTAVAVRNKLVDAYNEIMRMQV